jgi:Sap, sulfolipid-1-addressing protein
LNHAFLTLEQSLPNSPCAVPRLFWVMAHSAGFDLIDRGGLQSMNSDLANVFLLSLVAMVNPTLLAAVTVMLLLPSPKRLMLGYLLGAYTTSITLGLLIVFSLHGSSSASTSKHTLSPAEDIVVGILALAIAFVLGTGRDAPLKLRRERRREAKKAAGKAKDPWSQRMLGRGSARVTFVVGAVLSFPGVSFLDALDHIVKLNAGTAPTVLLVVYFCLMQQILLELPLLGYLFAPERTHSAVIRFRDWLRRSGRGAGVIGLAAVGVFLVGRGLLTLLT